MSFDSAFATFTASGFPVTGFPMIAPFWGDVGTGNASTDPFIGLGNTVCFCHDDMQWTTGDASGGGCLDPGMDAGALATGDFPVNPGNLHLPIVSVVNPFLANPTNGRVADADQRDRFLVRERG